MIAWFSALIDNNNFWNGFAVGVVLTLVATWTSGDEWSGR